MSTFARSPLSVAVLALALAISANTVQASAPGGGPVVEVGELPERIEAGLHSLRRLLSSRQDVVSHAIVVGRREASLELETSRGRTRTIALREGRVLIDGRESGGYEVGGAFDREWRRLLSEGAAMETSDLLALLRTWQPAGGGADAASRDRLLRAVRGFGGPSADSGPPPTLMTGAAPESAPALAQPPQAPLRPDDEASIQDLARRLAATAGLSPEVVDAVRGGPLRTGDVTVARGERIEGHLVVYRGDVDVRGEVTGSVVALLGDIIVHDGGVIGGNAVSVDGGVRDEGGIVRGDIKAISGDAASARESARRAATGRSASAFDRVWLDVRNVVAVFIALAMLGFGAVFFARRNLEIVADTAMNSPGRSFVIGLLGQLLVLPTFAMLIVGLVLTIVGILLLPLAILAYAAAFLVAVLGGYLAAAHAVGERVARRRMAQGAFVRAPNAYGYLFTGLVGLLGLWAAAALTGWMGPVVLVAKVMAGLVTWMAATVGFGAVLLSRAGLRENFAGRHYGEVSDEYLWAGVNTTPTGTRVPGSE